MTPAIIDPFHAIQIGKTQQHPLSRPYRYLQLLLCQGNESPPVIQTGQMIRHRQEVDFLLHLFSFRSILQRFDGTDDLSL